MGLCFFEFWMWLQASTSSPHRTAAWPHLWCRAAPLRRTTLHRRSYTAPPPQHRCCRTAATPQHCSSILALSALTIHKHPTGSIAKVVKMYLADLPDSSIN
jgi:hypothetical protein